MDVSGPNSPESLRAEIDSLWINVRQLSARCRLLEKLAETHLETPWWKRLLFVLDGWPLHGLAERPQWRPWRRNS